MAGLYERALKSNRRFATAQLKREAMQGKKGVPDTAALQKVIANGKDKLTTKELNAISERFDPSPKDPKAKKMKPKGRK